MKDSGTQVVETSETQTEVPPPLVILGPGRSFTTVAAGMFGQHPELYGLPELNLTSCGTIGEFMYFTSNARLGIGHGLVRSMAQLETGEQTDEAVNKMRRWLLDHPDMTTREMLHMIQNTAGARAIVDKSPLTTLADEFILRAAEQMPNARYLHITRDPFSACTSMMTAGWYRMILQFAGVESYDTRFNPPVFDPQVHWYSAHQRILDFLDEIPAERQVRIQGEALLEDPKTVLKEVCQWLEIGDSDADIEAMMHPERSVFACSGPKSAEWGADPSFQENPALRAFHRKPVNLSGALPWRADGEGFAPEVVAMAEFFGYHESK